MRRREIIHLNVADFAVAVEQALDSSLRGRPLIVAPVGAARAMVYDMSEEAYQEGVRKGMPLQQATRRCRKAGILPPHPERYQQAMKAFLKEAAPYSPLVEERGEGHLFLDATGTGRLFGGPRDIAWRIRNSCRLELGFEPSWSVAPNKLLAKVATRVVKPKGEYIVPAGNERAFLAPLPVTLLPGLAAVDSERLRELNILRVGQLAALSPGQLAIPFGRRASRLHDLAHGIDPSPVLPARQGKPLLGFVHPFEEDTNEEKEILAALYGLVEQAGSALRERGLAAQRLGLRLEYADRRQVVRQAISKSGSASDFELFGLARLALQRAWRRRVRVRRLQLLCDRLGRPAAQLSLFGVSHAERQKQEDLDRALDRIRARFGLRSVQSGRHLAAC